ncbi:MAG: ATP-binding protein [Rhodospirillales bacterium]
MVNKQFKISSALKNIIGKELITNDFIAVFELVKNAFDANATQVDVIFQNLDQESPKLIIRDNGKGMDLHDLENKWLFVAYSAKKEGTEDYRDAIVSSRIHAGAKGIGRFSCDKLGRNLNIYTRKKGAAAKTNFLSVDWVDFESDSTQEFSQISVEYHETENNPYNIKTGTVLEICELRENWNREKLLKLRRSLEKLINPNQDNDADNFTINLFAESEKTTDETVPDDEPWNIVNGPVKNFLFENLGLKTTFINVKISADGELIRSRLEDRGTLIFEITERNPFRYDEKLLANIEVSLFALNTSAKNYFTKYMGTQPVNFGSVFLYKNGFRIHPIGEYRNDGLGIDSRKTQGSSRFLGTRDVIGRIEINGENPDFTEASSRDGGLVQNAAYFCLREMFVQFCLKRLEAYAVDIVKYGNLGEDFDSAFAQSADIKSKILSLVQSLTKSESIIDLHYDTNVVDILGELSEQSLQNVFRNFQRIAAESGNVVLEKEADKAQTRLEQLSKAREEAEAEAAQAKKDRAQAEAAAKAEAERARKAQEEAEKATATAEHKTTENIFLRSLVNSDVANVVSLHHHIGIAAETIENYIKNMTKRISRGDSFSERTVLEVLEKISLQAKKIATTTRFATKANFKLEAAKKEANLVEYIHEYILNICSGIIKIQNTDKNINFVWDNPDEIEFYFKFRPLEISIVLDNLISNARKAGASEVRVRVATQTEKELVLTVHDNGRGIPKENADKIFDLAYTTTDGSGLGLYQTKEILNNAKGGIELESSSKIDGTTFQLTFRR